MTTVPLADSSLRSSSFAASSSASSSSHLCCAPAPSDKPPSAPCLDVGLFATLSRGRRIAGGPHERLLQPLDKSWCHAVAAAAAASIASFVALDQLELEFEGRVVFSLGPFVWPNFKRRPKSERRRRHQTSVREYSPPLARWGSQLLKARSGGSKRFVIVEKFKSELKTLLFEGRAVGA